MTHEPLTTKQRIWVVVGVILLIVGATSESWAEITLEEGATFDDGICWEADGTEGISTFDGQCMTPADYDEIFSYENLSTITLGSEWDQSEMAGWTLAQVAGIEPNDVASERTLGAGVSEPHTFAQDVAVAHARAPHMPIAD